MAVVSSVRLTPTAYVVLGLIEARQPATPYDIKQLAAASTSNFWTVPHTQLYAECSRLAEAGLLDEEREDSGRRRRIYRLTPLGGERLSEWRHDPRTRASEFRDLGVLKLFFGGDPVALAPCEIARHEEKLAEFEHTARGELPEGMRRALEFGIEFERTLIASWRRIADGDPGSDERRSP
ncbi:PadR family transcriptional regulator [Thermoleophilia bacterium SCSIO 60948]|nr:PadR family transcriptional regulator [Thermoleophilia bacterium SCSIO 60948]